MLFEQSLRQKTEEVDALLRRFLPPEGKFTKPLAAAMEYSLLSPGKRLRPILMRETSKLFGACGGVIEPFMAAIEMIHAYSLIHDDLPAMDNDRYRRGNETVWVAFGEAMAVLAGDALLNLAFETAIGAFEIEPGSLAVARSLSVLSKRAGFYGMIGGQCADVSYQDSADSATDEEALLFIHANKTAALIQAAMAIGAILAGASDGDVEQIERAALDIGLAFQIQDDILDVTGDSLTLGKTTGSDEKNQKTTFVNLRGLQRAREEVRELSEEAIGILSSFHKRNEFLERLVGDLILREK